MPHLLVRLDYTTEKGKECQEFYTLFFADTNGALAKLDRKMEGLRKRHREATLYVLDDQGRIDTSDDPEGMIGAVVEVHGRWECYRERFSWESSLESSHAERER